MATEYPRALLEVHYEAAARGYMRRLPLEHFVEGMDQATQREITLESLALVKATRPDVQVFNEFLIQYPLPRRRRPGQVVPDNMVIVSDQPVLGKTSFNIPLETAFIFWVLEYVSKSNPRKDYQDSFRKYEQDLKVPYYLLYYPDVQELTLFHHNGSKYSSVPANGKSRHPIPELQLEVAILDGWVRYWYKGRLLPLPGELQQQLAKVQRQAKIQKRRADDLQRRLESEKQARQMAEDELARLRAQLRSE